MIDVGKMIASIRKERGLSQQQLATRLNMSKQAISNYERGTREPDYVTLEAIADVLNVPVSMIISREAQTKALKEIYSTYENAQHTAEPEQGAQTKEWVILSSGIGKMPNELQRKTLEFMSVLYPQYFNEGNDDE